MMTTVKVPIEGNFKMKLLEIYVVLIRDESNYNPYLFFSSVVKASRIGAFISENGGDTMIKREKALRGSSGIVFPLAHGKSGWGVKLDEESIRQRGHPNQKEQLLKVLEGLRHASPKKT